MPIKQTQIQSSVTKPKKPWYTKWWIWALFVFVILGFASLLTDAKTDDTSMPLVEATFASTGRPIATSISTSQPTATPITTQQPTATPRPTVAVPTPTPTQQATASPKPTAQATVPPTVVPTPIPTTPTPITPVPATPIPVTPIPETPRPTTPAIPDTSERIVYIGETGNRYHKETCSTLKRDDGTYTSIPITLREAEAQGRTACGRCGG